MSMKRVAVAIISRINQAGANEFLLVSSRKDFGTYTGFYYPPGGHIEAGENEDETTALKRELREELGLDITPIKRLATTSGDVPDQETYWWKCEAAPGEITLQQSELRDAGYFTESQMRGMNLWPATKKFFEAMLFTHDPITQIQEEIAKHGSTGKIVIGIDGYSGVGKTTILKKLAANNPNILPINRDDFLLPRKSFEKLIAQVKDKSIIFETKMLDLEKIRALIAAFRTTNKQYHVQTYNQKTGECDITKTVDLSKNILAIEGILLFHPKQLKDAFDIKIFIDGDTNAADQRRIAREKETWGSDYFPEDHPDSYFKQVRIAFERYMQTYDPKSSADLVVHL